MIIFLSQFFSNTLKPFLIYFTLETVSTCLFSQLQSLFISSYKSSSSNTNKSTTSATHRNLNNFKTMTTVRIVFSILLLLYHVIGNGFLVYYLTEMVRHVRNSKITKETFEYDADYEMYSPLFVDLRLTSFFCLIPMIHGFGRVLQQSVISFSIMTISQKNHDLKEEHFTKTGRSEILNHMCEKQQQQPFTFSWMEMIAFWIGSIFALFTCFYQFSSIYFAFYQISVYWMGMSVMVMLFGFLELFHWSDMTTCRVTENHMKTATQDPILITTHIMSAASGGISEIHYDHDDEDEDEDEEHAFTEIFIFLNMYLSIVSLKRTLQHWAELFLNARIYENQSLMLLFLLTLDFHPLVLVFFLIMKGCDLLIVNYQTNPLWTLQNSYQSMMDRNSSMVSMYSILYHTIVLFIDVILTCVNSLPINYVGYQKVVYGMRDQIVFGCSLFIPVLLSQLERILFSSSLNTSDSQNFSTLVDDRKELEHELTIKRYLPIIIQLMVIGIICLAFDDPGLLTFKFFSDVSLVLQLAACVCLVTSYMLSFCSCYPKKQTKEKSD